MTRPTRLGRTPLLSGALGSEPTTEPDPDPADPIDYAAEAEAGAVYVVTGTTTSDDILEGETVISGAISNPANSNDRDYLTSSSKQSGVYSGSYYWKVDFGSAVEVSAMAVDHQLGNDDWQAASSAIVQWSDDDSAWTTVTYAYSTETVSTGLSYPYATTTTRYNYELTTPVTHRYWRIMKTVGGGFHPTDAMSEWWVFGQTLSTLAWEPGPGANDGDDTTYAESDGLIDGASARVALEVERLIHRAEVRIGTQTSGSRTYQIYGSDDAEFTTPVQLASTTFTATGSYTAQEIAFSWMPAATYQYYQFATTDQTHRYYDINLFSDSAGVAANFASVASNALALSGVVVQNAAASNYHYVAASSNTGYWLPHTDPDPYAQEVELSDTFLGTYNVQDWIDLFAANLWGADTVGSVTAGGSPVAITNDSSYNAFPGLARLDPDRVLLVYRKGSDHVGADDGRFVGKIGMLAANKQSVTDWGTEFEIYNHASLDVRGENMVTVIDGTVWVSGRHYNNGGTGDNQLPFVLKCNTPAADMTSSSTWTKYDITMSQGSVQNYTQGHLIKLQNGNYLQPVGWDSGGNHTVGVAIVSDPQNWAAPTFVTVGSGANDYSEICIIKEPDGTLTAHLRADTDGTHKRATGDITGTTWSSVANLFDALGYPMFRRLSSGIRLTVYRSDAGSQDAAWRQDTSGADTAYDSETILDSTGTAMQYAAILQLTPTKALCAYGIQNSSSDADIRSQIFTDSSTFGPTASGSVSFGSNSNEVSYANAAGASLLASRADHVHRGVTSIAHASNTFTGPVILTTPGNTVGITSPTSGTYAFTTLGGGGGGGGGGSGQGLVDFDTAKRTAGDVTCSADQVWTEIDSGIRITVTAAIGDRLEIGISAICTGTEAVSLNLSAMSMVSGSAVNDLFEGAAKSDTTNGVPGWRMAASAIATASGSFISPALVSGDLTGGTCIVGLFYRTSSNTNRVLRADTSLPLYWDVRNLGGSL